MLDLQFKKLFSSLIVIYPLAVMGGTFRGPKQFPFLALLPAEVWVDILINQVGYIVCACTVLYVTGYVHKLT